MSEKDTERSIWNESQLLYYYYIQILIYNLPPPQIGVKHLWGNRANLWKIQKLYLAVTVLEIIDSRGVPFSTNPKESIRQEPILAHDDEVGHEASRCLYDADLVVMSHAFFFVTDLTGIWQSFECLAPASLSG
jgi:hypothetical protein